MKKLFLFSIAIALFTTSIFSQPILNSSVIPNPSSVLNRQDVEPLTYLPTGSAYTWDFSSAVLKGTEYNQTFLNPSTTPYSTSFPSSTIASSTASGSSYLYFKLSANKYENLGFAGATIGSQVYSNPESFHVFPLSYNTPSSDNWSVALNYAPPTIFYRKGITTNVMDGYGTVITPEGTFNNVMRIKTTQEYYDSMVVSGTFIQYIDYTYTVYNWYVNGSANPVFQVSESLFTDGATTTAAKYSYGKNISVGIEENIKNSNIAIYPNPADEIIKIDLSDNSIIGNGQMTILDVKGAVVQQQTISTNSPINISSLSTGLYNVVISDENGIIISKRIFKK